VFEVMDQARAITTSQYPNVHGFLS